MRAVFSRNSLLPLVTLGAIVASSAAGAHGSAVHSASAVDAPTVREQQEWGIAGSAAETARTITIHMSDAMRFVPDHIEVRQGDTLRIVHHNDGATLHEMVIGTREALAEHAELMKKFPDMEHDEPWMAHVPAGSKGEVVWTFNRAGHFEFGCLIPGHYEAGMVGTIDVKPAALSDNRKTGATVVR
ncbi:MAG TPA: cupredoxin family protein [Aromatoleum sp.]|uniref:cupredoxin domain-containing protein n=1 Tax=Aromatoleum sp. TaxID=2307007 RepID=UPI002B477E90|nr:cupredoxin family protein [Aromatoleum sp.]HJV24957.1 cupredoxin family protein [Aromatoleum sp.]